MAGAMRKMAVYLGLVEDDHRYQDGYESYEEYEEFEEQPDRFDGPDQVGGENEPAHHMNIILDGEVNVSRANSGSVSLFIGRTARVTGKLPFSRMKFWGATGYSAGHLWVLDIHEDLFPAMLAGPPRTFSTPESNRARAARSRMAQITDTGCGLPRYSWT